MNSDVLKGKWNQLKGDLKNKWGKITDDEWTQIAGDRDKMIGKLQERYGRSREEITREVDQFLMQQDPSRTMDTGTRGTPFNRPNDPNLKRKVS